MTEVSQQNTKTQQNKQFQRFIHADILTVVIKQDGRTRIQCNTFFVYKSGTPFIKLR